MNEIMCKSAHLSMKFRIIADHLGLTVYTRGMFVGSRLHFEDSRVGRESSF